MRIICDMDNTICRTNEYFYDNCRARFGKPYLMYDKETVNNFHIHEWLMSQRGEIAELEAKAMKEIIFNDESYWATIPPYNNAVDVLTYLSDKFEIFIASDALTVNNDACMTGKKKWLKRFLPHFYFSNMIFIRDKSMLKGDIIIEDVPKQVENFEGISILMDYPYNRDFTPSYRVNNWQEILKLFEKELRFENSSICSGKS